MSSDIETAIKSLYPSAKFTIGRIYNSLVWLSLEITKPTAEAIIKEQNRLFRVGINNTYQMKRRNAYPPVSDYIDGIVKGDTAQVQAYIDKCKAVKAKYPKG